MYVKIVSLNQSPDEAHNLLIIHSSRNSLPIVHQFLHFLPIIMHTFLYLDPDLQLLRPLLWQFLLQFESDRQSYLLG